MFIFLLLTRRPPRVPLVDILCPYTTRCRSEGHGLQRVPGQRRGAPRPPLRRHAARRGGERGAAVEPLLGAHPRRAPGEPPRRGPQRPPALRSEEHTSELQSLMRISYAVFCLKKKTIIKTYNHNTKHTT